MNDIMISKEDIPFRVSSSYTIREMHDEITRIDIQKVRLTACLALVCVIPSLVMVLTAGVFLILHWNGDPVTILPAFSVCLAMTLCILTGRSVIGQKDRTLSDRMHIICQCIWFLRNVADGTVEGVAVHPDSVDYFVPASVDGRMLTYELPVAGYGISENGKVTLSIRPDGIVVND